MKPSGRSTKRIISDYYQRIVLEVIRSIALMAKKKLQTRSHREIFFSRHLRPRGVCERSLVLCGIPRRIASKFQLFLSQSESIFCAVRLLFVEGTEKTFLETEEKEKKFLFSFKKRKVFSEIREI